ncbi:uncharacterized protein TNIN_392731 [Trichonephila inaurata madagascariensis]|uniref:Uncharacterized protein n=1 Tax=Trichonephila inaurata madagascariensis TaxID=2747483 RepID=A0A8X6MBE1_9ARAC|nr:uncharacterized protein TNIN_392731 [Trichonephila inaurata madagascariensis]
MSDATNTDTGPNPPNVNNPSITSCSGFDSTSGHMELVPKHDYTKREAYYLPHHAVLRDSSTTKLRVVFDASQPTTGHSLNDLLMVDPECTFSVSLQEQKCAYSKREVLSEIARVFDPLGLLSPCVVFMKILLQEPWKLNLEWDEPIPEDLTNSGQPSERNFHLIEK